MIAHRENISYLILGTSTLAFLVIAYSLMSTYATLKQYWYKIATVIAGSSATELLSFSPVYPS